MYFGCGTRQVRSEDVAPADNGVGDLPIFLSQTGCFLPSHLYSWRRMHRIKCGVPRTGKHRDLNSRHLGPFGSLTAANWVSFDFNVSYS